MRRASVVVVLAGASGCGGGDADVAGGSESSTAALGESTGEPAAESGGADSTGAGQTGAVETTSGGSTGAAGSDGAGGSGDSTGGEGSGGALDDVLRLSHVQVRGTHNSYHVQPALPFHPSHEYTHAPLDVQLHEQGVRAFELDVHEAFDGSLHVYHIAGIDAVTTCDLLADCLDTIAAWSDAHPEHLPVIVWFEIKDDTGGLPIDDLGPVDDAIAAAFSRQRVLTPDDVQGEHASIREALQTEGWPTLGELRGRVAFVVLDLGEPAESYSDGYTTLAGRTMFVRADTDQFDEPWAAIAKLGLGDSAAIEAAHAAGLLIATNVCGADDDPDDCHEWAATAMAAGIHMLKDDFPAPVPGHDYWLDLPDGNPARCNPVTAPRQCTPEALEDL